MKILYYWAETDSPMQAWQRHHFIDELEKYNIFFEVFNPLMFSSIEEANDALVSLLKKSRNNYDLFFTCEGSNRLFDTSVRLIKEQSIPTLLVCFDNLHDPFMHQKIAPYFDLVWLTSFETKYMFDKWGCNTIFQPYASNPFLKNDFNAYDEIKAIGFIGTLYGARAKKINYLIKNNIPCSVYGNTNNRSSSLHVNTQLIKSIAKNISFPVGRKVLLGAFWEKFLNNFQFINQSKLMIDLNVDSVEFEELVKLYSQFALSLGVTELRNTFHLKNPIHKLHLRTFEIPMFGGLQIAPYTKEISNYFEDGKEILLYSTQDEMLQISKDFLSDNRTDDRLKMKYNAYIRARNEHTWKCRFDKIFIRLFGKINNFNS